MLMSVERTVLLYACTGPAVVTFHQAFPLSSTETTAAHTLLPSTIALPPPRLLTFTNVLSPALMYATGVNVEALKMLEDSTNSSSKSKSGALDAVHDAMSTPPRSPSRSAIESVTPSGGVVSGGGAGGTVTVRVFEN